MVMHGQIQRGGGGGGGDRESEPPLELPDY